MTLILTIAHTGGAIISSFTDDRHWAESHLESLHGLEQHQSQQRSMPGRRLSAAAWARGAAQKAQALPSIMRSEQISLINGCVLPVSQKKNASTGPRQPLGRVGPTDIIYLPPQEPAGL